MFDLKDNCGFQIEWTFGFSIISLMKTNLTLPPSRTLQLPAASVQCTPWVSWARVESQSQSPASEYQRCVHVRVFFWLVETEHAFSVTLFKNSILKSEVYLEFWLCSTHSSVNRVPLRKLHINQFNYKWEFKILFSSDLSPLCSR